MNDNERLPLLDFTNVNASLRDERADREHAANVAEGQGRDASVHRRAIRRVKVRIRARCIEARIVSPRPRGPRRRRTQRTRRTGSRSPDSSEGEPPRAVTHGGQA